MPPPHQRYRPVSRRRRLLILLLAIATATTVVLTLLDPVGRLQRMNRAAEPVPAPCIDGNLTHCIGGKAEVIVPPAGAASRPSIP